MYAVIQVGSQQYQVSKGSTIQIAKVDGPVGSEIRFSNLVMVADGEKFTLGHPIKGTVFGKILAHERGKKIHVFKKKRRKGYTRSQGHRQTYTKVEISRIEV